MKKLAGLLLGLSLGLIPLSGQAAQTVSVSPGVVNHPANTNPAITLSWTVVAGGNDGTGQSSSAGTFLNPAGALMSPATGPISDPACPSGATCSPIAELLIIPASIISQAQIAGYTFILYQRTFSGSATFSQTASANVTINLLYPTPTVTATPGIFNVLIGSPGAINITWQVTTFGNGAGTLNFGGGTFATAPNGNSIFSTGGITLAPLTLQAFGTSTTFENLTIPKVVMDYAQQNSLTTLYYGRDYSNDNTGLFGELYIRINLLAANPNTALTINRVALRFSDNTSVKIALPKTNLIALADINYFGSGLFDAMWEVAEPVSTAGEPIFVPLQPVRQFLVGGGMMSLQSPILPAQQNGLHVVRLKICSPTLGVDLGAAVGLCRVPAILQYMISPDGNTLALSALPPVRIHSPADNALMTADTRFEWKPIKAAHGYQLELFLPEQSGLKPDDTAIAKRAPDSGMIVPAKKNSLILGELSRNKLRPNTTYYWRIIAIGNNGQILSASALREIRIP